MSFKTDKLLALMPEVFAARDHSSLLYKLLDSVGAEHMRADEKIKQLLKSHWVDYANGAGLDGLGAALNIERRRLRSGGLESDEAYRQRLKGMVPQFTGGGTIAGVLGAVRAALGLPFNLDRLNIPPAYAELRQAVENLVQMREFSPQDISFTSIAPAVIDGADHLQQLQVEILSVESVDPSLRWQLTGGSARNLRLLCVETATGFTSVESFVAPPGALFVFSRGPGGALIAAMNNSDVSDQFVDLDGVSPATLSQVPGGISHWEFRARGAIFDTSLFDEGESFDPPQFEVSINLTRLTPLSFDVTIPYFLSQTVEALAKAYNYSGNILVFEGLPPEAIQDVVNQTKAAGVRGNVLFRLDFLEKHDQQEVFNGQVLHTQTEQHDSEDGFHIGGFDTRSEDNDLGESFIVGARFDVATFDSVHGFL